MKYQVLFCLKNNEEVFIHAVCCCCDWRFKRVKRKNLHLQEYLKVYPFLEGLCPSRKQRGVTVVL